MHKTLMAVTATQASTQILAMASLKSASITSNSFGICCSPLNWCWQSARRPALRFPPLTRHRFRSGPGRFGEVGAVSPAVSPFEHPSRNQDAVLVASLVQSVCTFITGATPASSYRIVMLDCPSRNLRGRTCNHQQGSRLRGTDCAVLLGFEPSDPARRNQLSC